MAFSAIMEVSRKLVVSKFWIQLFAFYQFFNYLKELFVILVATPHSLQIFFEAIGVDDFEQIKNPVSYAVLECF